MTVTGCGMIGGDDSGDDVAGGKARVRVAHLAPDAPPIDFCLAPHGTQEFTGPVLAGIGGIAGLSYSHVTQYLEINPGAVDVRLVAPAAADCSASLGGLPDTTNLPELGAGATATIAAIGTLTHGAVAPFELRAYVDEAEVAPDKAKLRFVHASPGTPNVDVGLGGGVLFTALFEDIAFGATRGHDNGYLTTDPFDGAEISARATGTRSDVLAIAGAGLPAGSIATAFAIGQLGSTATPLRVLLCNDNGNPHGIETECHAVGDPPQRAQLRVAHLSPDAPAVDVCIAAAGSTKFAGPLLAALGSRAGLEYPQVTTYVPVPVGAYDVRIVLASETTCDNAAVPDTRNIAVTTGLVATVAAIGVLDRSGAANEDPLFRLAVFADDTTVAATRAKVRFIHASPGTGAVDVGLLTAHGFSTVFGGVTFGNIAKHAPISATGYFDTDPFTATLSARPAGTTTDALVIHDVEVPAGALVTAFAIGNKTGATTNPLRALLCADNAPTTSLLTTCRVAP